MILRSSLGMSRTKKGMGFNEIMAIVYILFLAFATVSLVFLVRHSVRLTVDTSRTEIDSYITYLLYAKNGLSLYDEDLDRVYPGTIDLARFKEGTLESSLNFADVAASKELPAAKLELFDLQTKETRILYWNELWYQRLDVKSGLAGTGSPNKKKKVFPVVIAQRERTGSSQTVSNFNNQSNYDHAGLLSMEVIVPR